MLSFWTLAFVFALISCLLIAALSRVVFRALAIRNAENGYERELLISAHRLRGRGLLRLTIFVNAAAILGMEPLFAALRTHPRHSALFIVHLALISAFDASVFALNWRLTGLEISALIHRTLGWTCAAIGISVLVTGSWLLWISLH